MNATRATVRLLIATAAVAGASACSDRSNKAAADSSLARDLALASTQAAQPTFQDTAIAPAPQQAGRAVESPPSPVTTRAAARAIDRTPRPVQQPAAQEPAPVVAPVPAPVAAAPAPAPAHGEIGAGTGVAMTSGSKVCSSALPGDKFVATINNQVTGSNGAIIPSGSTVVLEVASAAAGQNADNAQLTFRVKAIVVGDKTYTVAGDVATDASMVKSKVQNVDPNADRNKVVGGAIAGAILGQVMGHSTKGTVIGAAAGAAAGAVAAKAGEKWEACLPSGAQMRLTLSTPLVMS